MKKLCSPIAVLVFFAGIAGVNAANTIYDIGDLAGGANYSYTTTDTYYGGLSADGTTVAGYSDGASGNRAFYWTSGSGIVDMGALPDAFPYSNATGLSGDGSVITGFSTSFANPSGEAFRWTSAGGMVGLGTLAGGTNSMGYAISNDGNVIVGKSSSTPGRQAFMWTSAGGMVGLGDLAGGSFDSQAYGISGNGQVIVGTSRTATATEAFMWTSGGGMVGLGILAGSNPLYDGSYAYDATYDGSVIVGWNSMDAGVDQAFMWDSVNGMVGLGYLSGYTTSYAYSVTEDGSFVVGSALSSVATIWDSTNGWRDLATVLANDYGVDMSAWVNLTEATSVSLNGNLLTIAGYGDTLTATHAFMVTVTIPEPSTYAMLMGGLALAAAVTKRKR